jgi:hypothetical protein
MLLESIGYDHGSNCHGRGQPDYSLINAVCDGSHQPTGKRGIPVEMAKITG